LTPDFASWFRELRPTSRFSPRYIQRASDQRNLSASVVPLVGPVTLLVGLRMERVGSTETSVRPNDLTVKRRL